MAVISERIATPLPGKTNLTISRAKALAAIIQRAGGLARVFKAAYGEGAGNIHLYASFKDFTHAAHSATVASQDPEMAAWQAARDAEPSSHMKGPYIYRTMYGKAAAKPGIMQREYTISRGNLAGALALMPELQAVVGDNPIEAIVPTVAPHMDSLGLAYYFDSLEHYGAMVDSVGMSPAFQQIVTKASELGTLKNSRLLVAID